MLSIFFCFCMLHNILQVQIRDAGKEETALAVYWVMDGGWCQVGFVPWHFIKHMGKNNGVLAQVAYVYNAAYDSNYRRQKVYKNHGFAKAVLILACDTTNEAEEAVVYATT